MATVVAQPTHIRQSHTPPPLAPILNLNTSIINHVPVPNKHLQPLSPGCPPSRPPDTPPASPPTKHLSIKSSSILYPPDSNTLLRNSPPVYSIDAQTLVAALDHMSSQPLPEPKQVFPWLHGLHPENNIQLSFFVARRKSLRKTPKCIRGITVVKVGSDLTFSKLKGAVGPEELLCDGCDESSFIEADPIHGFSVRNFQIQPRKMAMLSDIIVYGDDETRESEVRDLAIQISNAQAQWKAKEDPEDKEALAFHTFMLTSRFEEFERLHQEIVATDSNGRMTGHVMDFFQWERIEMCSMSRATEIAPNVWLGPTPDVIPGDGNAATSEERIYDVLVEASDLAQVPDAQLLKHVGNLLHKTNETQCLEFPSSGSLMPPSWSQNEIDGIMDMCQWTYNQANFGDENEAHEERDCDGDLQVLSRPGSSRRVLIHCTDGYTESSLLALAYFMYAEACPVDEAWLRLHCEKERNFFAYPSDVAALKSLQPRILHESPKQRELTILSEPAWLSRMDGSLPSRILPYMYLGNLGHANNPDLLRALGIKRILSVGEPVTWSDEEEAAWGRDKLCYIDNVQDNGVDPLMGEFARCLEFIRAGRSEGVATLVHCRVGVSRSATICIAEVMSSLGLSFPRAYCFVRARRLNVIIQPHLRFSYELLKWEEWQQTQRGQSIKRELEWATIAREIASMNLPYSR